MVDGSVRTARHEALEGLQTILVDLFGVAQSLAGQPGLSREDQVERLTDAKVAISDLETKVGTVVTAVTASLEGAIAIASTREVTNAPAEENLDSIPFDQFEAQFAGADFSDEATEVEDDNPQN